MSQPRLRVIAGDGKKDAARKDGGPRMTASQRAWLVRGIGQAGGKLPLFDEHGKRIDPRTIRRCLEEGWAEPWFSNPTKPDWLVCRLTDKGREAIAKTPAVKD
jgi:hypothetical protein